MAYRSGSNIEAGRISRRVEYRGGSNIGAGRTSARSTLRNLASPECFFKGVGGLGAQSKKRWRTEGVASGASGTSGRVEH